MKKTKDFTIEAERMKIKTKDFKTEAESENFICIGRTFKSFYNLYSILNLFEEMEEKGYKFIYETEFNYIFKKRI